VRQAACWARRSELHAGVDLCSLGAESGVDGLDNSFHADGCCFVEGVAVVFFHVGGGSARTSRLARNSGAI